MSGRGGQDSQYETEKQGTDLVGQTGPQEEVSEKVKFNVDRNLIPAANLDDQASKELEGLDLDVFNQDDFEQGVLAQVDQALEKEEEERRKNALKKDLKAVTDEIKVVKHELANLETELARLGQGKSFNSGGANRRLQSAKRQKENKESQMKTLEARKKSIQAKLDGKAPLDDKGVAAGTSYTSVLGLGSSKETEKDKKIRTGEMTPFGTVVTSSEATAGPSKNIEQSRSEKDHTSKSTLSSNEVTKAAEKQIKQENLFDKKDKRHYRNDTEGKPSYNSYKRTPGFYNPDHNFSEDPELSDHNDQDSDEWLPSDSGRWSDQEFKAEDDKIDTASKQKKKKKKKKAWPPPTTSRPIYHGSDSEGQVEDEGGSVSVVKDKSVRKSKDDGNIAYFEGRMSAFQEGERKKQMLREAGELSDSEDDEEFDGGFKVPGRIWVKLYKYQKTCVKWLWELHCQQAGGIIGDEMGLGKTIQMISFLTALKYSRLRNKNFPHIGLGPCIVVCPATVMHQWVKEFHTWWPVFRVAILHSSGTYSGKERDLVRDIIKSKGILVTSYTTLVLQQDNILPYDWHYVVLDEGHKIRNPDVQATLCCKQFRTPHRVILSGSPIQNNLKELWSLMDFVFPGRLGTLPDFMQHFAVPILQGGYSSASPMQVQTAYKCACVLRDTINPYLLRRMKADVKANINLPGKSEQVLFCRLTEEQRDVYQEYLESRECQAILRGQFQVFAGLITLRKICNHPDLSTGGPRVFKGETTDGDASLEYGYWRRSGKMIVVEALLRLWKKQGQRALLFSQSKQMLDVLEAFVQEKGYTYVRMDGGTSISARQPLVQKYNENKNIYLFLLTTRVGGLGINLVGANRIIIYDPDWNPSTDMQARERAWRIGQERQVTIYRLLTTGTIEEKIYHRQIFKQFLTNRVLKDPKQRRLFKANDLYELFSLGVSDDKGETETAAIFAGTGSDVTVKPKKLNRFDKIREQKKREEKDKKDEEEKDLSLNFDQEEIQRMRELAKRLSQKMEQEKNRKADDKVSSEDQNGKVKLEKTELARNGGESAKAESTQSKSDSKKRKHDDRDRKEKHKKKKHKRKHRDASFEGERIPHLDKARDYKNKEPAQEQTQDHEEMDNYVLQNLFKKTGIQGALKHDKIMEPGKADYVIIEAEANKVAKEASIALKKSRSLCLGAMSGVPSWTGHHGSVKKPRFGVKKNSQITTVQRPPKSASPVETSKDAKSVEGPPVIKDSHFDGSQAGSVQTDLESGGAAGPVSSNDLLSKMRTRNEVFTPASDNEEEDVGAEFTPDQKSFELIQKMREFILFECHKLGQATTKELLEEFGPKLPPKNSAKFRAMLHTICDFEKVNGQGIWKLRRDYK